jgi:hypothetical protein
MWRIEKGLNDSIERDSNRSDGQQRHLIEELAEVEGHVRRHLGAQLRHFRLVPSLAGLTLCGRAQTYYAKQLAQKAVRQATRMPIIANEIEVC